MTQGELSIIELNSPPDDYLPDEPEGAAFHKAFQLANIARFKCFYLAIYRDGQRIAVVPCFLGRFSLTTLFSEGWLKKSLAWIQFSYACVGHPSTDFGMIDGEVSADILQRVNSVLSKKAPLVAYKGFSNTLPLTGFIQVNGLPVAVLRPEGDYYSTLNGHRRNDFRHKLHAASALRVETYSTLPEHLVQSVYQCYLKTLSHATLRFEILTPDYFRQVGGLGLFHLYFKDQLLVGFLQMIIKNKKANLKYMGMDPLHNRRYYLYFALCLRGIEAAIAAGCTRIELGVSSYQAKQLLGCELIDTCVYYRHNNTQLNWLLGKFRFLLKP